MDELIEGRLPRASMIILAGSPGSGKTIASAQFLYHGAKDCDENGVYVSFSERKDVFMKNMGRFGVDFADLEKGRFKFLDFATTKEPGMSSTLNELLNETFSIKARRLVVDSFSAMAHACMKEVLIPVSDLSVLLDAFAKIPRERTRKPRTILFDNLSDTILMCGFDKTYRFLRFLLEAISSPKITALFIFNPSAHNPAISSSIRGLFQFRLTDLKLKIVESIRRD